MRAGMDPADRGREDSGRHDRYRRATDRADRRVGGSLGTHPQSLGAQSRPLATVASVVPSQAVDLDAGMGVARCDRPGDSLRMDGDHSGLPVLVSQHGH